MYSVFSLALNVKMKILISAAQFDRGPLVPIGAQWCPVMGHKTDHIDSCWDQMATVWHTFDHNCFLGQ